MHVVDLGERFENGSRVDRHRPVVLGEIDVVSRETFDVAIEDHADDFELSIPVILDGDQTLASRVDAKVTPEAIVIPRGSEKAVYRGKIDNLYEGYGKKRRRANKHYLNDALTQLLTGKEIALPSTKPIGCYISYPNR